MFSGGQGSEGVRFGDLNLMSPRRVTERLMQEVVGASYHSRGAKVRPCLSEMREQNSLSKGCQNVSIFLGSSWRPEKPFVFSRPVIHPQFPFFRRPPENPYNFVVEDFMCLYLRLAITVSFPRPGPQSSIRETHLRRICSLRSPPYLNSHRSLRSLATLMTPQDILLAAWCWLTPFT